MMNEWFGADGVVFGPAFVLLEFMVVFILLLVWVFRPGSSAIYEQAATLPFDDEQQGPSQPMRKTGKEAHGQGNR